VGEYIAGVRRLTGAEMVDLVAHSMGGLISRAYLRAGDGRSRRRQLIMLGSPMAGTDCANLPAALGLYLPATLELRPSYVRSIFNTQITQRRGSPSMLWPACRSSKDSSHPAPMCHRSGRVAFERHGHPAGRRPASHPAPGVEPVGSGLRRVRAAPPAGAGGLLDRAADPSDLALPAEGAQFSRLFQGHVDAGSSVELTIPIDPGITVATFALYDTTRTLQVSVTGASGKTIELDTEKNGLVVVDDPEALFYLGYGFADPKPGPWRVRLVSTPSTPTGGADFALTARFVGGTQLTAQVDPLLPPPGSRSGLQLSSASGARIWRCTPPSPPSSGRTDRPTP